MMPPAINDSGVVAFLAYDGVFNSTPGIYLGDGVETVLVARHGYALRNSTIADFIWPPASQLSSPSAVPLTVNERGQVAYTARLADGTVLTQLFTPTLRWRGGAGGGNWSDVAQWTLGLRPTAAHDVRIDAPGGATVNGPAGNAAVRSLAVAADSELRLAATGEISVADGAFIEAAGLLSGSGAILGDVRNAGTLAPGGSAGTITIDGDYVQTGRLDIELLDGGFDLLEVSGTITLGGDIHIIAAAGIAVGETFEVITAGGGIIGSATWHLPAASSFRVMDMPGGGQAVEVTYVPEPSLALAASLFAVAASVMRRRRRWSAEG